MGDKAFDLRFTIQFSRTDPAHLRAAEILNQQGRRSKAQYLVNAVLHYESCNERPNLQNASVFNEKIIEAVVRRFLREQAEADGGYPSRSPSTTVSPASASLVASEPDSVDSAESAADGEATAQPTPKKPAAQTPLAEDIGYDEALETLGQEGFDTITGALIAFRNK
jgi:hypothetical protein